MTLKKWDRLPEFMRTEEVRQYYEILKRKQLQLVLKRIFDLSAALVLFVILLIPMFIIAIWIKADSKGPVFFRQERVTKNGKHFRIHKFRTMVAQAEQIGSAVTVENDHRITKAGSKLRHSRLDELPQLLDVISGSMTFVGTRPEAVKYVEAYEAEYFATLLLPAGVTSEASICFKDEDRLLLNAQDIDSTYIHEILPKKMAINLRNLKEFSLVHDLQILIRTVGTVFKREKA